MEVLQARLDSFTKSKRVKHSSSKRTVSVKWPHPDNFAATPNALAEAGFYFNPSWDDRDNVVCYLCNKELSGWEEADDPFAIHWDKCRDQCAWALVRCGMGDGTRRGKAPALKDPAYSPTGKTMDKARLTTFKTNGWWPYDSEKGHGASSSKVMSRAGFVYTPQASGDDTATCFFCNISLSGWDADDDPLEEHRKREKKTSTPCPFFSTVAPTASGTSLAKSTTRAPSSRTSTKPRSRAGSKKPLPSERNASDASQSDSEDEPAEPAPRRRIKRSTSSIAADPLRRSVRSSRSKPPSEVEEEASGSDAGRGALGRSVRGKGKGKEKTKKRIEVIEEEGEEEGEVAVNGAGGKASAKETKGVEVVKEATASKSTRKGKSKKVVETDEEREMVPKKKVGRPRKKVVAVDDEAASMEEADAKSKSKPRVGRPRKVVESEDELAGGDDPDLGVKPVRKGKKRIVESATEDEEPLTVPESRPKAALKVAKAKAAPKPASLEWDEDSADDDSPSSRLLAKLEKEVRKAKAPSAPPPPEDVVMDEEDEDDKPPPKPVSKKLSKAKARVVVTSSEQEDDVPGQNGTADRKSKQPSKTEKKSHERDVSPATAPLEDFDAIMETVPEPGSLDAEKTSWGKVNGVAAPRPLDAQRANGVEKDRREMPSLQRASKTAAKKAGPSSKSLNLFQGQDDRMDVDDGEVPPSLSARPSEEQKSRSMKNAALQPEGRIPEPEEVEMADVEDINPSRRFSPDQVPASPPHRSLSPPRRPTTPSRTTTHPLPDSSPLPPPASSSLPTLSSLESNSHINPEAVVNEIGLTQSLIPPGTLTEEERGMTVEQWIRRQIDIKAEQVRLEIENQIAVFKEKVEETRRRIEAL
ncbi:hypothetical protein EW146_g3474 [Bondarzewia mesenterica]|uniref:BIR-domain-containing protein n=1 Tax=Bondarzewia mesenterica TaxID=1095465 RepID=A0A4S4M3C9_9AGAM|nr:hypothetical protein EW146_g3474 [Bondarzewia mesenterica]